jgi:hypothetical protein
LVWLDMRSASKHSCIEGLVPKAAVVREGLWGSDWITRVLTSSMDSSQIDQGIQIRNQGIPDLMSLLGVGRNFWRGF